MYNTILWDNDGVLVDTEGLFFAETRAAFARLGLELTEEMWVASYLGKGTPSKELAREMGADPERIAPVLIERNKNHLRALEQPIRIRPRVRETLAALEGKVRMAMVTGGHRQQLRLMHDTGELLDYFEVIVTGDEATKSKPDPEPYLMTIEEMGVDKSACLAVEDSQRGLAAALAAGIACIVVPTKLTCRQDFTGALSVENDVSGVVKYVTR